MIAALILALAVDCPMHAEHLRAVQAAQVDARHDTFGMAHDSSHHNFRLFKDGGAIELRANDMDDTAMIDVIRKHLREVDASFVKSDFSTPMFVHGRLPDGLAQMKLLPGRSHTAMKTSTPVAASGSRPPIRRRSPRFTTS